MEARDILLDNNNEIRFLNGDFFTGEADDQHIQHILQATKGNFLENPTVGVNIVEYQNGNISLAELTGRIRIEIQKDGYFLRKLSFEEDGVNIDATRIR